MRDRTYLGILTKSNCCEANLVVVTDGDGTSYYECSKCELPCDPK